MANGDGNGDVGRAFGGGGRIGMAETASVCGSGGGVLFCGRCGGCGFVAGGVRNRIGGVLWCGRCGVNGSVCIGTVNGSVCVGTVNGSVCIGTGNGNSNVGTGVGGWDCIGTGNGPGRCNTCLFGAISSTGCALFAGNVGESGTSAVDVGGTMGGGAVIT